MKTLKALFWGCLTGAALAYIFAPRRIDLLRAKYGIGGQTSNAGGATPTGTARSTATTGGMSTDRAGGIGAGETTPDTLSAVNAQTATAANAAFIGNTHTRVYHSATDSNLPSEENRAYFATAEDAEAAGYRPSGQTTSV